MRQASVFRGQYLLLMPSEALSESNVRASDLLMAEGDSPASDLTERSGGEEEEAEEAEAMEASPASPSSQIASADESWLSPVTMRIAKPRTI
jgi:hypothetical protein